MANFRPNHFRILQEVHFRLTCFARKQGATTTSTATKASLKRRIRAAINFVAFIPSRSIRQIMAIFFLEFNSKGLYRSQSGKEKENCCFVFTFSTKRENRKFHVVGVHRRQRNCFFARSPSNGASILGFGRLC